MGVLVAVEDGLPREVEGVVGENLVESLGNLAANVGEAGRRGDVVVFVSVEHLDRLGVVRAAGLVDEPADPRLSPLGCEGEEGGQAGVGGNRTAEFDVRHVGATERQVVLVDGVLPGVVLGLDEARLPVVVLPHGLQLVEPVRLAVRLDAEPRAVDTVETRKRSGIIPERAVESDVDESVPVTRKRAVRGPTLLWEAPAPVAFVFV